MIIDGERIKELVEGAKKEVILCSPFIKTKVLAIILEALPEAASVRIVTRWRPAEVVAGVSDLEAYDIARERPNTEFCLLHSLHAKLYLADDNCLVGSANLTASALGWCQDSNLEILLAVRRSDPDVARLLEKLATATPATFQIRAEIEKQIMALDAPVLDESKEILPNAVKQFGMPWLPRCAAPDKLYTVYQNRETTIVVEGTRADAIADLNDMLPPPGLGTEDFTAYVRDALSQFPSFQRIFNSVAAGLSDAQGMAMIAEFRQNLSQGDLQKQWHIVREWISVFFRDRFEVATESYIIRLKSH